MIGVTIAALWPEGDHDMWPHPPQVPNDLANHLTRIRLVEVAVGIIEEIDLANAQPSRRRIQLGLAYGAERRWAGVVAGVAEPAALAARRRHKVDLNSFGGILGQRAAITERLVVGVGQH